MDSEVSRVVEKARVDLAKIGNNGGATRAEIERRSVVASGTGKKHM